MSRSLLDRDTILAALYDWHNALMLRTQQRDVDFFLSKLHGKKQIAVMGAGTGRVATPLARQGHTVLAIDSDPGRLARIPSHPGLSICHGDFGIVSRLAPLDQVIFPYSAIQLCHPKRYAGLLEACGDVLADGGSVWLDVSARFAQRRNYPHRLVAEAACAELGNSVAEYQAGTRERDHFRVDYQYVMAGRPTLECTERWYFVKHRHLIRCAAASGLRLRRIWRGYGVPGSSHRRVYELCRG